MRLSSKVILGMAMTLVLALGVFALNTRSAAISPGQLDLSLDGDPIILKGGSLTIQCPTNDNCLPFNAATKKLEHKDSYKKVQRIIIKDESGAVIANVSKVNFPNGKPTIEVYYK